MKTDALAAILWSLTPENKVACEICLATGWRIDDVLSLTREQLERAQKSKRHGITIKEQKTGKKSTRYFSGQLLDDMAKICGRIYVFQGQHDYRKHRTRQAVYMDLKRAKRKFNIKTNLAPHSLRKNYAVYLRQQGKSIEEIQKIFNHENAAVTMLYALADELTQRNA